LIGETISRYRVVAKVGAGGMGEVYRAHDPRLERDVAIKVLPAAATSDPARLSRFEREARSTGALNHPNILAIYDVGQHNGVPYIVTELLDGSTLRQRLRAGDLTPRRMVDYAIQIADGLAAAHARGIIHRDLKPENLFITRDGHLKILDFGLAKLHQPASGRGASEKVTQTMETEEGAIVGTLGYMSPEQLHGKRADQRSDIFAFGAVMYEMLAGRRAFSGDSKANVMAAILRDDPPTVAAFSKDVPPQLEQLLRRCLEKRPEDRFASAHDLALALRSVRDSSNWSASGFRHRLPGVRSWSRVAVVGAALALVMVAGFVVWGWWRDAAGPSSGESAVIAPLPETKKLIILPFEAPGSDGDRAALARGISEWLADSMVPMERQTRGTLWALPPGRLAGEELKAFWREAGLTLATEGDLTTAEGGQYLRLRLVDLRSEETYREGGAFAAIGDLCALMERAASEQARLLELQLAPPTISEISRLIPDAPEACDGYLRGLGLVRGGETSADFRTAIMHLEAAAEADPDFGPAQTALAEARRRLYEATGEDVWLDRSREAVTRALELDRGDPRVWLELARLESAAGRKDARLAALEQAAKRSPHLATPHMELGRALKGTGRLREAEAPLQRAIRLRPGDGGLRMELGHLYWDLGERDAAINQFREAEDLAPESSLAYSNLCGVYLSLEVRDRAREMCERSLAIQPNYPAYSNLGYLAFSSSNFGEAVQMYKQALDLDEGDYLTWGNLGLAHHHMDKVRESRPALEHAVEMGEALLEENPSNPSLMVDLAVYNALLGNRELALDLLGRATTFDIEDSLLMALAGEAYEDAGDRDHALQWVSRALENGLDPSWIGNSPTLRRVEAFRSLATQYETGS